MNEIPNNLWPGWETVRSIGRGSFGAVYEIQRTIRGRTEHAALKVLSIPQHESEVEELRADGYDDDSITQYFADSLDKIEGEYAMMADMKGHSNVVYCDDIQTVQHDNGYGWDIYIKMELLTPLKSQLGNECSEDTVVQLGKDICNALKLCEELHIVHRDIKPENIFVARDGNFKLGDFGIAKTMENTTGGTKTGTYDYMAPEVYNNQPYHTQADIYSLGLVLYWLLNERTAPFLEISAKPTPSTKNRARERRFSGEALPDPKNGSDALKAIVLKACAYKPEDRYQSAAEMMDALAALGGNADSRTILVEQHQETQDDDHDGTVGPAWNTQSKQVATAVDSDEQADVTVGPNWKKAKNQQTAKEKAEQPQKPKRKWLFPVIAGVLVIALLIAALSMGNLFEPKHTHSWEAATCLAPKTCITCGATEGDPAEHIWAAATCTEGKICTACGAVGGAARGHNWTAATNTAPKTCTTCGAIEGEPLKTIAIIAKGESHAFWQAIKAGAIAAGKETGYNVTFCGPTSESESEVPSQIEMVRDALDSHVHGIGLATIGLGFSDELIRAYNLGIPVAEFDSGLYSNNADVTFGKDPTIGSIATSNYRSGENAAENLYAYLKSQNVLCNGYKVGIIQHDITQTGIDRANGFKNKIQSLAFSDGYVLDINVQEKMGYWEEYKLGLTALTEWGAQAIFMTNEGVVNAVYPEVRDSAAAYMDILFVGFDAGTNQYEWIKDAGTNYALLVGSVAQDSYMIGYQTVRMLVDKLSGRAVSDIDVVGRWYTAENVDELMAQNIFYMG